MYIHYSVHSLYVYDYACMLFYCICLIHLHAYRRVFFGEFFVASPDVSCIVLDRLPRYFENTFTVAS